ncbi:MAG: DHH family phosphohydrolase-like protein [Solivirus sp.]|uniref:DHH family phosphohydrolase-like protein n=1 Tax=Solivirus sp. TaxID=2487772 RepID=A0A3G5AFS2_9VIRU|nr:MAG: DHH family phosphohydrolase-like protein [Solivirus sp.]
MTEIGEVPVIVLYDEGGLDNFIAAYTIFKYYNGTPIVISISSKTDKTELLKRISSVALFVIGGSYTLEEYKLFINESLNLVIIDSNPASKEKLEQITENYKVYEEGESVAKLAYEYFYPDKPLPNLYSYLSEKNKRFITALDIAIRSLEGEYSFSNVDLYISNSTSPLLLSIGELLISHQRSIFSSLLTEIDFQVVRFPEERELLILGYLNIPLSFHFDSSEAFVKYPFLDLLVLVNIDFKEGGTKHNIISRGNFQIKNHLTLNSNFRLSCDHLSSAPLLSIISDKELLISTSISNILSSEYEQLLNSKFPNSSLKIIYRFEKSGK